jgi:hypothetical protein
MVGVCLSCGYIGAQQIREQTFLDTVVSVREGELSVFDKVFKQGSDINIRDILTGKTPLIVAIERAPLAVPWFLERGASIESADNEGNNAVHYAVMCSRSDVLKLLFETDKREGNFIVNRPVCLAPNNDSDTPLLLAAFKGDYVMVQMILDYYHPSINDMDTEGNTALHEAYLGFMDDTHADGYHRRVERYELVIDLLKKTDCSLVSTTNVYGLKPSAILAQSDRTLQTRRRRHSELCARN